MEIPSRAASGQGSRSVDQEPAASEEVAVAVVVRNVAGEGEVPPGTVQVEAVVRDETVAAERWSR